LRCNIDAIAKDVVAVDDDIANVYSKPELDAGLRPLGRSCPHFLLNGNRASHGIDSARELDQQVVAGSLDNAASRCVALKAHRREIADPGQRSSVAVSIMEQPSDLGPAKSIAWFCKPTYNRGRFVRFTRA
jgi:hypothetical protein